MCPNQKIKTYRHQFKSQSGFLMPVAAFIVVVMGLLVAGMSLVGSQSAISSAQEQISIQTFYAAESGAQLGMSAVFYDSSSSVTRSSATNACTAVNGTNVSFTASGMQNCQTLVSCIASVDGANTTTFFNISSSAQCGIAPVNATRVVDVSAFIQ